MLKQRIITAIFLAITLIAATVLLSSFWFSFFITVAVLLACWEWCAFIGLAQTGSKLGYLATLASMIMALYFFLGISPSAEDINGFRVSIILGLGVLFWALAFLMLRGYPGNASSWNDKSKIALMGLLTLIPTWVGIIQLKYMEPLGYLVLTLVILVAAADIGAYFVGRTFGKNKLAPDLSPNKTWEGVWGGLAACLLVGLASTWFLHNYLRSLSAGQIAILLLLSLGVTFLDVIGDLLESMLKRNQSLKDSGALLPGHGGILDRVDGLLAVTPIFALTFLLIE
ncbi:MAG: phosphatidate cytidylyltransferase [Gammaproteobacteria bacterium]|nr:phosphatidate cytidylyltransferase [Gammaproteobacteria bacterium]MDD9957763.1 phosphatidate cytidylyltransferase [Gammaproteobacteria bacterium]